MQRVVSCLSSLALVSAVWLAATPAAAEPWKEVYDPLVVRHLHIQVTETNWLIMRNDETFDIEVPGTFWADDEAVHTIKVRRKSATPIGDKISYKLDFGSNRWRDLKNLSLENGDDNNVVSEGLAWYFHRLAGNANYQPGYAAWTKLTLHIVTDEEQLDEDGNPVLDAEGNPVYVVDVRPQGVYLNVEQPDKRFLVHRGITDFGTTWLYKQDDIGLPEMKESPNGLDSPAYVALDYAPFQTPRGAGKRITNPTPDDATLENDLEEWTNMDSMLRLGAANAFVDNPDELFNHAKNYFWADFAIGAGKRLYYPWDLDASIRNSQSGIYANVSSKGRKLTVSQHPFQEIILNHPTYRVQYNNILTELLDGPYDPDGIATFLDAVEFLLTDELLDDPNNQIGDSPEAIADFFTGLRSWVAVRHASVRAQVEANGPPAPRE